MTDLELENWRREWRVETEPVPDLKRKIHRQNLRIAAAVLATGLCLTLSTVEALRRHSWFMGGMAVGIGVTGLLVGGYAWWVRRGAWRPTAQTTLAYAELSYKRAIAKARTLRFAFYFLLAATVLFTGYVAWNWKHFEGRSAAIVTFMVIELFVFRHLSRRKKLEIEEMKKLIDE
jgi:predicted lysophospholipase L1 biosynthesis ABC-type transport system permease subunit